MRIQVIHGPNLNLLGSREVHVYGQKSLNELKIDLETSYPQIEFSFFQSNIEGEIIDVVHDCIKSQTAIIINPGGYSHTSVAIHDALINLTQPKIEVHISNIHQREAFRHNSITAQACNGVIAGLGFLGYSLAVEAVVQLLSERSNSAI